MKPGAVHYDPATGQFLSVDPLVDQTGQAYAYTGDDPVNGVDPMGLYPGEGWVNTVGHALASAYNAANSVANTVVGWASNRVNSGICQNFGGGNGLLSGLIDSQAGCGSGGPTSTPSSACSPSTPGSGGAFAGALKDGSSAADARAEASKIGIDIPPDYVASPAVPGPGWVFRPPGQSGGDQNSIRVMEQGADPTQYPDGYARTFNSNGHATNLNGNQIGSKGVGQEETHFPLLPDE